MKRSFSTQLVGISFTLFQIAFGQGFVNLNFEQATIAPTPVGGATYPADPGKCFPGWSVGGPYTVVSYNDLSLGAPAVDLMGPEFPNFVGYTPIQGSYSVLFQYFGTIAADAPSLSQTGLVPVGTESIDFLVGRGADDAVVTMNGVNIPLVSISAGELAGDASAFAGTMAQLTISTTSRSSNNWQGNWLYFDDIQFSSSVVPEPNTLSLFTVVLLIFCWRRTRPNLSPEQSAVVKCRSASRLGLLIGGCSPHGRQQTPHHKQHKKTK